MSNTNPKGGAKPQQRDTGTNHNAGTLAGNGTQVHELREKKFKTGDIAYLNSDLQNSTPVTIIGFKEANYNREDEVLALCVWIRRNGKPRTMLVPLAALRKVSTDKTPQP